MNSYEKEHEDVQGIDGLLEKIVDEFLAIMEDMA